MKLHIDIETFSSVDIRESGAYKYIESPDFEILMVAFAIDDGPIRMVDLAQGEELPPELIRAFKDPEVEKWAHNATFERICLRKYGYDIPIEEWYCTAIKAAYCGLPLSLELVSKALELEDKGKLSSGRALIRYFCSPIRPTKANGRRGRNFPHHDLEKWEEFKLYCINDVEAERQIELKLRKYKIPESERNYYITDQEINDRGVRIDKSFTKKAIKMDSRFVKGVRKELIEITGVENPNSPAQLRTWLSVATGKEIKSLARDVVTELISEVEAGPVLDVLEGRQKLSKSSTKKYISMINCICDDYRAHGLFQFYGANRTGRWAGRLIQLQNLPQIHMRELEHARDVINSGDYDLATMLFDNISNILSELIRTALIPSEGNLFVVSDFSAIEARVLSWIADEKWRMDVFNSHGKIYEASASLMFGVPIESIGKGSTLRQRGKTAELALGYQGSVGAMAQMDRDGQIPKEEIPGIVERWRRSNPRIVKFWWDVHNATLHTIKTNNPVTLPHVKIYSNGEVLRIQLPSGRCLFYQKPGLGFNKWGGESIIFHGMNHLTKQWEEIETYGGKLTENIVQAISRDLLANSMQNLKREGMDMVMHVHDEVVAEAPKETAQETLKLMEEIMSQPVSWAPGLPLTAAGFVTEFYKS